MKKVTLNIDIQEDQVSHFLTLIKNLDYASLNIPEWQKEEVQKRISSATADDYISWEDAKKALNL